MLRQGFGPVCHAFNLSTECRAQTGLRPCLSWHSSSRKFCSDRASALFVRASNFHQCSAQTGPLPCLSEHSLRPRPSEDVRGPRNPLDRPSVSAETVNPKSLCLAWSVRALAPKSLLVEYPKHDFSLLIIPLSTRIIPTYQSPKPTRLNLKARVNIVSKYGTPRTLNPVKP